MTTDANYMTGRDPEFERRRLASQAALLDDRTFSELRQIGVTEGWPCLELGAGTGTVVRWLLEQVGPTGEVVAVDLDTAALEQIGAPNLEVRSGDAMAIDLGESRFDLVVGRLFFEHVAEREALMERCVRALKPGGWIWIYDADYTAMQLQGSADIERRWRLLSTEVFPFGPAVGRTAVTWAGGLHDAMNQLGLADVHCYRMERWVPRGSLVAENWRNIWRQRMNQLGSLPESKRAALDDAMTVFDDPAMRARANSVVSAWGRKPA